MSVNATNATNLNKNITARETLEDTDIVNDSYSEMTEIISGDVSTEIIDSKGRISDLRSNLGLGEYDDNGRAMVPGTIYKDESQHTQTANKHANLGYKIVIVGEIPPLNSGICARCTDARRGSVVQRLAAERLRSLNPELLGRRILERGAYKQQLHGTDHNGSLFRDLVCEQLKRHADAADMPHHQERRIEQRGTAPRGMAGMRNAHANQPRGEPAVVCDHKHGGTRVQLVQYRNIEQPNLASRIDELQWRLRE